MKPIRADCKPIRRPGRLTLTILILLGAGVVSAAIGQVMLRQRITAATKQIEELEAKRLADVRGPLPPRPDPVYAKSVREMLRERDARWAAMLRSLESAAMVGVTPTRVEFNAVDGSARVELAYGDPAALLDYIDRLNQGLGPADNIGRWSLVQLAAPAEIASATEFAPTKSSAKIGSVTAKANLRSHWAMPSASP